MIYENGIVMKHVDFGRGFAVRFTGDKGVIDISRDFIDSSPGHIAKRVYTSNNHYQDWIDAIKNNTQPICDVETGHRTSSLCAVANISYWLRRPLEWDPQKEQFKNDGEANGLLTSGMRAPWKLV
jgi:hypothetical protein